MVGFRQAVAIIASSLIGLSACGGGGSPGAAGPPPSPPPLPPQAEALTWDNGNWDEVEWQ
jgi:hypothetical protein